MRTSLRLAVLSALLAAPALGHAQASVQLRLDLPVVMPQLVVVSPGVQVVPDCNEEVFYSSGWYWVRQDGGWYRSHNPHGGWYFVQPERVPQRLVTLPPGHYRRWHGPPPRPAPARWAPAPPPPRPAAYHERHDDRFEHDRGHGEGHGRGHDKREHGEKRGHGDRD